MKIKSGIVALAIAAATLFPAINAPAQENEVTDENTWLLYGYSTASTANIYNSFLALSYLANTASTADSTGDLHTVIKSVEDMAAMFVAANDSIIASVSLSPSDKEYLLYFSELGKLIGQTADLLDKYNISRKTADYRKYSEKYTELYHKMEAIYFKDDK
ncbi:MAG: hypothetical protein PHV24_02840 [Candidatus Kapabacteria bacterium]|nr:hypothetical protein [Candidatus Kapabacteria bacterium]